MTRKELRNSEQKWRATKQHQKPYMTPKRGLRVRTLLKWILIITFVTGANVCLYQSKKTCESINGVNSRLCVD